MEFPQIKEYEGSQKKTQNKSSLLGLYRVLDDYIPLEDIKKKNDVRSWIYGYNEKYDVIVISKDGTIGDIYEIQNLKIALPKTPDRCKSRSHANKEQFWEREEYPSALSRIGSIMQWNETPKLFKQKYIPYIEEQFEIRDKGLWFRNNGVKTYITGSHWMYLQWSPIDVGYPDYREANRIHFIFWEACKADDRCFGEVYLKIRRSGFSFMGSSETVNTATQVKKSLIGILSKTGKDAKGMFTTKVVPISQKYPFFFKPIQDGMDKPKTELSYRAPAQKITKNNMYKNFEENVPEGLETVIDYRNTGDNAYDSEKLKLLIHDEAGKYEKPNNILVSWRVQKTCLRIGSRIIGKCMMGSTVNARAKGGEEFKKLYEQSNVTKRNKNGRTESGLYSIFIPMEYNLEGHIDRYGMPVMETPEEPIMGVDGEWIKIGAIDWWYNEVDALKNNPDELNEFYRQNPRTEAHAFRDESKDSLFNLNKIYSQIDYNDGLVIEHHLTRGRFGWANGERFSKVLWYPDTHGRFLISWIPPKHLQNNVLKRNGYFYPANEHIGSFGCDSYDITGTVGGLGSNAALSGMTKMNMDDAPSMQFFLEYLGRPKTAEICFEEMLMALWFYGMPVLAENNKPRFLYHLKNAGMRGFSLNRPDKHKNKLSKTELELGGIPNSSQDVLQSHASAIESYIEKYVGYDLDNEVRDSDEIGYMPFNRTLHDWASFDITNRTKHDLSISSGLAVMANQKHMYLPNKEVKNLSINFAMYNNKGIVSERLSYE